MWGMKDVMKLIILVETISPTIMNIVKYIVY